MCSTLPTFCLQQSKAQTDSFTVSLYHELMTNHNSFWVSCLDLKIEKDIPESEQNNNHIALFLSLNWIKFKAIYTFISQNGICLKSCTLTPTFQHLLFLKKKGHCYGIIHLVPSAVCFPYFGILNKEKLAEIITRKKIHLIL